MRMSCFAVLCAACLVTDPRALASGPGTELPWAAKPGRLRERAPASLRLAAEQKGPSALDKALEELPEEAPRAPAGLWTAQTGSARLRLVDISLDVLAAAGGSSASDGELQNLQGGDHDPRKRGFTLQQVELSFIGAVDPYLTGEAHLIYFLDPLEGESIFELEEAFFTTQSLPWGLQLEGGQFFTEFGAMNPVHPHAWDWMDQPVILNRLFGPDGLRGPGARLGWLAPLPWFSEVHLGAQNASGETMVSFLASEEVFEERPVGGRPFTDRSVENLGDLLYLARWVNSWDPSPEWTVKIGVSGLAGPNATGPEGRTWIYGADLKSTWRPVKNFRGWPFVLLQAEVLKRDYEADEFAGDDGLPSGEEENHAALASLSSGEFQEPESDAALPPVILRDWGLYAQALWGFRPRWAAGLRYEFARGHRSGGLERSEDPFRDTRHRVSPLLVWQPTEYSRFRLQYNFDRASHLEGNDAHSVWVGAEFLYGAHPAHAY
ncbi:MAG: hypothetical protein KatS3mg076_1966 [Candidatus Binatia bacterium]|nr:MAG: hypothetical protein KatS3mg076_1966 [Candidatus Binatia bacterium]